MSAELFEYVRRDTISPQLMCTICKKPFLDPTITPCNHNFCKNCIEQYLQNHGTCPVQDCDKLIHKDNLKAYPEGITRQILDQLPVQCKLCGTAEIHRRDFDKHIEENCPKAPATCCMKRIGCSWIGTKEEVSQHMKNCAFSALESTFDDLYKTIHNLNSHIEQLQKQFEQQKMDYERLIEHKISDILQQITQERNQREEQMAEVIRKLVQEKNQRDEQVKATNDHLEEYINQQKIDLLQQLENQTHKEEDQEKEQNTYNVKLQSEIENQSTQLVNIKSEIRNQNDEIVTLRNQNMTLKEDIKKLKSLTRWSDIPNIAANARWTRNCVTIAGHDGCGDSTSQLNYPYRLCMDDDQTLIIADFWNHRIIQWRKGETNGQIVAGGNRQGSQLDQLSYPTDVLIDKQTDSLIICDSGNKRVVRWSRLNNTKQGEILIDKIKCWALAMDDQTYLYVCDTGIHEVRRYGSGDKIGTVVAGGHGQGNKLNQLDFPVGLVVDQQQNVYVSERGNHRVMKWNKGASEGIIVAGGQDSGDALTQLNQPHGIYVDTLGAVYVADFDNNRVMRWLQGAKEGTIIVSGSSSDVGTNHLDFPADLTFDQEGNLYVADFGYHRVQKFAIE